MVNVDAHSHVKVVSISFVLANAESPRHFSVEVVHVVDPLYREFGCRRGQVGVESVHAGKGSD